MRYITTGSAPATAMRITIEELWTKRRRARVTATRPAPAGTSTIRTERWKAAVSATVEGPTAAASQVHSTILKITGGSNRRAIVGQAGAIVGHMGAVSVTGQWRDKINPPQPPLRQ